MTATEFLEVFASLSLQAALLVTITHWGVRWADREAVRSRLWAGCHLLILALTVRAFVFPRLRLLSLWPQLDVSTVVEITAWQQRLGWGLLAVWALGAIASLVMFLAGWIQVHRFLKSCHPLNDPAVLSTLQRALANTTPSTETVRTRVLVSPRLRSPFCWQVHRPLIVLPESLLDFDPDSLRLIVRHELEHLRTGHPLTLFVQRVVEMVFWFHPMIWWSTRQAALSREFTCDEAAVASRQDIASYLRSLLRIVEECEEELEPQAIELAFGRSRGMIAQRAARLVGIAETGVFSSNRRPARRPLMLLLTAAALAISVFFWTPIDLLKSPRSTWSPWPTWSARVLHSFGLNARDYDTYDHRFQIHELQEEQYQRNAHQHR